MMSLFSSNTGSHSATARRFAWYGLFLVGTMVVLWGVTRATTVYSSDSPPESSTADSTVVASSTASGGAPEIEIFTWGNVMAFLLLGGGGAVALYLRQRSGGTTPTTPFTVLGKMGLGSSKHIHLVACGGEVLLLSVTEDEITLLKTYPHDAFEEAGEMDMNGEVPSPAAQPASSPNQWSGHFEDVLRQFTNAPLDS